MAGFRLSREAGRDIEEIEDYTARQWGDAQAEVYVRNIFDAFGALARDPTLGRKRPDVPAPYLVYDVGRHLIIYRYDPADMRVDVLNILHPAMNIRKRLAAALRRTGESGR